MTIFRILVSNFKRLTRQSRNVRYVHALTKLSSLSVENSFSDALLEYRARRLAFMREVRWLWAKELEAAAFVLNDAECPRLVTGSSCAHCAA